MSEMKEKMHTGELYLPGDEEIIKEQDIPAGVVAVGNPCRAMREISVHDKEYYYKDRKIN